MYLHTQPAGFDLGLSGTGVFLNDGYLMADTVHKSVDITEMVCNVKDFPVKLSLFSTSI